MIFNGDSSSLGTRENGDLSRPLVEHSHDRANMISVTMTEIYACVPDNRAAVILAIRFGKWAEIWKRGSPGIRGSRRPEMDTGIAIVRYGHVVNPNDTLGTVQRTRGNPSRAEFTFRSKRSREIRSDSNSVCDVSREPRDLKSIGKRRRDRYYRLDPNFTAIIRYVEI